MSVLAIIAALVVEQWRPLGERHGRPDRARRVGRLARALVQRRRAPARRHGMAGRHPAPIALAIVLHASSAAGWPFALCSISRCSTSRSASGSSATTSPTSRSPSRRATSTAPARSSRNGAAPRARRGGGAPLDRGSARRRSPTRVRGAALVPAPARPERRDPVSPCCLPRRALAPMGAFGTFAGQAFHVLEWPAVRLRPRPSRWSATSRTPCTAGAPRRAPGPTRTPAFCSPRERDGRSARHAGAGSRRPAAAARARRGEEADGPFLDTTVGMLWRALVLWVAVLAGAALVAYGSRLGLDSGAAAGAAAPALRELRAEAFTTGARPVLPVTC